MWYTMSVKDNVQGHELMRCEVLGKEGDVWVPMQFDLTKSGYTRASGKVQSCTI